MTQWPWDKTPPDASEVAQFVAGPGIQRLPSLAFDIAALQSALADVLSRIDYDESYGEWGFGTVPVTRRPGTEGRDQVDLSGRFWTRPDATYEEVPRDETVDEAAYSELVPEFVDTYFETVLNELRSVTQIGRVRINLKQPYNANSWHRDPEPRIHIPIHTNPGCLFIVNHFCTHLPADGSTYFTDTRGYHTALNGGETPRIHLVAAVVGS
jgi:hypothetical protein